jgi:CubicO group peptidase (beta-lactamase class C family)
LPDAGDTPGRAFAYSNMGYVLLAEVLRCVTGRDPASAAEDDLFAPLGMSRSALGQAPPYALPAPPPRTVGDGGLWTSASDLLLWLEALNQGLLGNGLTHLLQTPGRLENGTALDYAWGISVRPTDRGITYTHGGSWPGWTAKTVRNPTTGTALALLTCHSDTQVVSDLAMAIHDQLRA